MAYKRTRPPGATDDAPDSPGGGQGNKAFPFAPKKPREAPPPVPEIEEHPDVTEGKMFPCANCGAQLQFDPSVSSLSCQYCGHVQEIPQSESEIKEHSYEKYFEKGQVAEEVIQGIESETRCPGCGASVMLPAGVKTSHCPFCAASLTNPIESAKPMMKPEAVIPFLIEEKAARIQFHSWVKSRWFAPNALKKVEKLDQINGVYLPYWTYDAMTYNFYTGQRGDAYWETVGFGDNKRRERKIRWTRVSGNFKHFFDDVCVCATNTLPKKFVRKLEPWDSNSLKKFDYAYLSGFKTERYQLSTREGFSEAQEIMKSAVEQMVRSRIGGDEQRITSINTQHDGLSFKLVLMPVWLAAYRYQDKVFRIFVNASTGEVQGERPWSWIKITLAVLAALVVALIGLSAFIGT